MENNGNEMAYAIIVISVVVFVASFFIDRIDFKIPNKKGHH